MTDPDPNIRLTSQLLREKFVEVITLIPDEFFNLPPEQRSPFWQELFHLVSHGVRDVKVLAGVFSNIPEIKETP